MEDVSIKGHLNKLGTHRSMGSDKMRPFMVRDPGDVTTRTRSIIFEKVW